MALPYFRDQDKWALILGGSSGLGLATAQRLAREGMHLMIVHRDRKANLDQVEQAFAAIRAQGVGLVTRNVDALRADQRALIIKDLERQLQGRNRLFLLLHAIARGNVKLMAPETAPIGFAGDPGALRAGDLTSTVQAMGLDLYAWTQALRQRGLFAPGGRILALTSEGSTRTWPGYAAVGVAKAALEALTKYLAAELGPTGLRCNVVRAGVTETPSLNRIPGADQLKAESRRRNPLGRLTRPEDVADVVYLLCREEANWVNGAVIPVDGGEGNR